LDLQNIDLFAKRVAALAEYRQRLHQYIKVWNNKIQYNNIITIVYFKDRMDHCAPSLAALLGEQVKIEIY
jgi:RNA processing factor Prp31